MGSMQRAFLWLCLLSAIVHSTVTHPPGANQQQEPGCNSETGLCNVKSKEDANEWVEPEFKKALFYATTLTNEGISHNMREMARALVRRGVAVRLMGKWKQTPFEGGDRPGDGNTSLQSMFSTPIDPAAEDYITISGAAVNTWHAASSTLKNFVGYFVWEGQLPPQISEYINNVPGLREIWTCSEYCHKMLKDGGINVPVSVLPHGVDPVVWQRRRVRPEPSEWREKEKDAGGNNASPREKFVFLGAGTWHNPRKGLDVLVRAFTAEFGPEEPVKLVLKVSNVYNEGFDARKEVRKYMRKKGNRNIMVVDSVIEEGKLVELVSNVDCYVSPHRTEGFGLFILQAMAVGTPVICTGETGNVDFTHGNVVELTNTTDYPLEIEPYGKCVWRDPSVEELRARMREVYEGNYPYDTAAVAEIVRRDWSWDKTIQKMFRLMKTVRSSPPQLMGEQQ